MPPIFQGKKKKRCQRHRLLPTTHQAYACVIWTCFTWKQDPSHVGLLTQLVLRKDNILQTWKFIFVDNNMCNSKQCKVRPQEWKHGSRYCVDPSGYVSKPSDTRTLQEGRIFGRKRRSRTTWNILHKVALAVISIQVKQGSLCWNGKVVQNVQRVILWWKEEGTGFWRLRDKNICINLIISRD